MHGIFNYYDQVGHTEGSRLWSKSNRKGGQNVISDIDGGWVNIVEQGRTIMVRLGTQR